MECHDQAMDGLDGLTLGSASASASDPDPAALRVLASGSRGNCAALKVGTGRGARVVLLDAGLSPKRTGEALRDAGLSLASVTDIVFTHLDQDHCHPGWCSPNAAPQAVTHIHRSHRGRAERMGLLYRRSRVFDGAAVVEGAGGAARFETVLASHDSLGVAVFRVKVDTPEGQADLGYATDLGHVPGAVGEHLRGVDALAIESNYCPALQQASDRPEFLKRRIMGGSGHLSNQQSAEAVTRITPAQGAPVVLLHLSEECNSPDAATAAHRASQGRLVISSQRAPTVWTPIRKRAPNIPNEVVVRPLQGVLWG